MPTGIHWPNAYPTLVPDLSVIHSSGTRCGTSDWCQFESGPTCLASLTFRFYSRNGDKWGQTGDANCFPGTNEAKLLYMSSTFGSHKNFICGNKREVTNEPTVVLVPIVHFSTVMSRNNTSLGGDTLYLPLTSVSLTAALLMSLLMPCDAEEMLLTLGFLDLTDWSVALGVLQALLVAERLLLLLQLLPPWSSVGVVYWK
jgi:hypothetical protein